MNINITFLKYFSDLAKTGSVLKSSHLNFVSQPAISQGIKKLEDQLGIKLLHHKQRGVELTAEGKKVFKESQQVFQSIESFESHVDQLKGDISGVLDLGSSQSVASHVISPIIAEFSKKYPNVDISISFGKTNYLKQLVKDKKIEFAIAIDNGELNTMKTSTIHKGKFVIYGKNLDGHILVTEDRPETIALKKSLIKSCEDNRFLELESWTVIKDFVTSGLGVGLIPDYMIQKKEVKYLQNLKNFSYDYKTVIFSHKAHLSLAAKEFISFLEDRV